MLVNWKLYLGAEAFPIKISTIRHSNLRNIIAPFIARSIDSLSSEIKFLSYYFYISDAEREEEEIEFGQVEFL